MAKTDSDVEAADTPSTPTTELDPAVAAARDQQATRLAAEAALAEVNAKMMEARAADPEDLLTHEQAAEARQQADDARATADAVVEMAPTSNEKILSAVAKQRLEQLPQWRSLLFRFTHLPPQQV